MMNNFPRLYSEIHDIWGKFCSHIDFNINIYRQSEIVDGGASKILFIEAVDKKGNYKISQSFYQADSWTEFVGRPFKLNCIYESPITRDIELSIWGKDFFERIFKSDKIDSGNIEFDRTFSGFSNDKLFMNRVFQDFEIQNILLQERLLVLNVTTENKILKISLKNMNGIYYTVEKLEDNFKTFKHIVEQILKSL
jgi:hypothetical protein